jgi:transmembrane sensor
MLMNKYKLYSVSDFVLDTDFIQWVYESKNNLFWNTWMEQNPEKVLVIAEAKKIVQTLQHLPPEISAEEVDKEVSIFFKTIHSGSLIKQDKYKQRKWWLIAASLLAFIVLGWGVNSFIIKNIHEDYGYYNVTSEKKGLVEQSNRSKKTIHILLPDSSSVDLTPQSRLSYNANFIDSANRDVFLLGEAFFNVTKNPQKPFRVFANGIVTKVLGTSFNIRSFDKEETIKVTVRTGKVRVYSQTAEPENTNLNAIHQDDILLTPNLEVTFKKSIQKFEKKILDKPVIIDPEISLHSMIYQEIPVIKVLEQFKKAYGISIIYDKDSLKSCTITADLTDESLYSRLDFICKAIDANYEIIESEIFIRAKGCK